jgi:hypothetical protein
MTSQKLLSVMGDGPGFSSDATIEFVQCAALATENGTTLKWRGIELSALSWGREWILNVVVLSHDRAEELAIYSTIPLAPETVC